MTGFSRTGKLGNGAGGAAQRLAQLRVRADETAALGIAEGGSLGPLGEVGAELLQLRIGAERVEPRHSHVELAA